MTTENPKNSIREPWTNEEMARASAMWEQGVFAKDIALQMGRSRNAVIGKMHRMKTVRLVIQKPIQKPTRHKVKPFPPPSLGVTFMELEDGMCKWPVNAGMYCGFPTLLNRPWCAMHAQKAARKAA